MLTTFCIIYGVISLGAARAVFARIRPSRVVEVCTHDCREDQRFRRRQEGDHRAACYRRQRPDLTCWPVDHDYAAAAWGALAGCCWWLLLLYLAIVAWPPETSAEKARRLEKESCVAAAIRAQRDLSIAQNEKLNLIGRHHQFPHQ